VRYAIGVTDLGMISTEHLSIKPLKLDGIAPSIENLQAGAIRLAGRFIFIITIRICRQRQSVCGFYPSEEARKASGICICPCVFPGALGYLLLFYRREQRYRVEDFARGLADEQHILIDLNI
jgi:hypothetical protein